MNPYPTPIWRFCETHFHIKIIYHFEIIEQQCPPEKMFFRFDWDVEYVEMFLDPPQVTP